METGIIFVIVLVIVIFIVLIGALASPDRKSIAAITDQKIAIYGIQKDIIKRTEADYYQTSSKIEPGVLVLTWNELIFFGTKYDYKFLVSNIRSVSSEYKSGGSFLVLYDDTGAFRFQWPNVANKVTGLGVAGGSISTGMAYASSGNPIVQEWVQLIDDLRFGKLKKPN